MLRLIRRILGVRTLKTNFIGTLIGTAVGDSLGLPVESLSRSDIKEKYGYVKEHIQMKELPLGTYSDDTQLTLVIAESLVRKAKFDGQDIAKGFKRWLDYKISEGSTCVKTISNLNETCSNWQKVGRDSWGNGGAMRVAAIGAFFHNNYDDVKKYAIDSCMITHKHRLAIAGAVAIAYSVAYIMNNLSNFIVQDYLVCIARAIDDISTKFAQRIHSFQELLDKDVHEVILNRGIGTSEAFETVSTAIFCFAKSPGDFEKSILTAVNIGGDVDTIAAMTGAISGAFNGFQAIPKRNLKTLENGQGGNGRKGRDYIIQLAKKLHTTSMKLPS